MKTLLLPALAMVALLAGCGDPSPPATSGAATAATVIAEPVGEGGQRGGGKSVAVSVEEFGGDRASYTVMTVGGTTTVTSKAFNIAAPLPEGTQRVKFADGTLVLDIDGNGGKAYRVYQAAFDRKPDMGGYVFWLGVADAGTSMTAIAAEFTRSKEFKDLYGSEPSNADLLTRYYRNVLHRSPDPAGYAYWLKVLDTNPASRAQILADFSESPENQAQVLADIQQGIWIPATPKLEARIAGGLTAMPSGRAFAVDLGGVALTNVSAKIGTTPLTSRLVEGQLLLLVPQVPPGSHMLDISAGGQTVRIPITVTSLAAPTDPRAYIDGVLAARDAELMREEALAAPLHAPLIKAFRAEIATQRQVLASSTDQEMLRQTAAYIAANAQLPASPVSGSGTGSMSGIRYDQGDDCIRSGALVLVAGAVTFEIGAAAVPLAIAPPPVNAKALALASAGFVASIVTTYSAIENFAEQCFSVKALRLEDVLEESAIGPGMMAGRRAMNVTSSSGAMVFTHKKSRSYALKEKEELLPPGKQVRSAAFKLASLLSLAQETVGVIGINLNPYVDKLSAFRIQRTKPATASKYRLGTISNSAIEGVVTATGDRVALQFRFREGRMPKDPVGFSFELLRTADGKPMGTFHATLHPEPPAVIDAIFAQSHKTVDVTIPPIYERKYECVPGAGPTCDAGLFCKPDEDLGSTWSSDMRYTFDAEKKTATLYFPDGTVVGTYLADGGVIGAEVQYEKEEIRQGTTTFYGGGGMKLSATYDAAQGSIVGSMLLTTTIAWSIDAKVQVCTATVTFNGKEKTRLSPVVSAMPVQALP